MRYVCALSVLSHLLCGRLFTVFLQNERSKQQLNAEVTKLRMSVTSSGRGLKLLTDSRCSATCLHHQGNTACTSHNCPQQHERGHSECLSAMSQLGSDLAAWCLGELQAWPRSVGNQQSVGLDCSVQNYRGSWRGRGYDFSEMEPVQDCD